MGYDGKYGNVTTEFGDIPDDEPVIVFRARDMITVGVLKWYRGRCVTSGCPDRHLALIEASIDRFWDWQQAHRDEIRYPDSESSREWMGEKLSVRDDGTEMPRDVERYRDEPDYRGRYPKHPRA
jgi:hypothetical protein